MKVKVTLAEGITRRGKALDRKAELKKKGYKSPKIKKYLTRDGRTRYEVYVVADVPSRYM